VRTPDNGRALPPLMRPSTVRFYAFDETISASARDIARGATMVVPAYGSQGPPRIVGATPRVVFMEAVNNKSVLAEGTAVDAELLDALIGTNTVALMFRPRSNTLGAVFAVCGADVTTASANILWGLFWSSFGDGTISYIHEQGSGSAIGAPFQATFAAGKWMVAHIRKVVTGVTCDLSLFINGALVQTIAGLGNCDGGSASVVRAGHLLDAAGANATFPFDGDIGAWVVNAEALTDEQIADDARRLHLLDHSTHADIVLRVGDLNGAWVELTNAEGVDLVDTCEISDNIDNVTRTMSASLLREQEALSTAGLVTTSKLNLSNVFVPSSFAALIRETAPVELLVARMPLGLRAGPGDLESAFLGEIDEVDDGGDATTFTARDLGGRLIDTHIEEEINYGDVTPVAVEGEMQFILNDNDNDAGNNSVGGLTARMGSYAPITLFTPVAPSWSILLYRQRREPVMTALRALAGQIGWDCRYMWDPTTKTWRLTFFDVDRTRVGVDAVFRADDILEFQELSRSTFGVRNIARVVYASSETTLPSLPALPAGYSGRRGWSNVDGEGNRLVAFVEIQSDASLAVLNRRYWMEAQEQSAGQIDTIIEGTRMGLRFVQDLEESDLGASVTFPLMWEAEVNTFGRFEGLTRGPRGLQRLFTGAQKLAIKTITSTFDDSPRTSVQLRGKPALGFKRWLAVETRNGKGAIASPLDALTDLRAGPRLQIVRELLDQTRYFTGGKFLAIRNQEFEAFSAGLQNPPDGWSMQAGAWATDAIVSTTAQSGARSVRLVNTTAALRSDFVVLPAGSLNAPFSLEALWQRVAGDDSLQVDVEWYSAAKTLLATTSLFPGSGTYGFPAVPATTGAWFTSRAQGFMPPNALSRYVRIIVRGRQVGAAFSAILVDNISMYRTSREVLAGNGGSTPALWGATAVGANFYNQAYGDIVGAGRYDRGNSLVNATLLGPPNNGLHVLAREPGTYEVDVCHWPIHQVSPAAATKVLELQLILNGTYGAGGVRTGGTLVARTRFTELFTTIPSQPLRLRHVIDLVENDRLTVDLGFVSTTAGAGNILLGSGPGTDPSLFRVKIRGMD